MKKILKLIIVCFTVFTIVGCSSEKEVQQKEMNDEAFLFNLNEGLAERWADDSEINEDMLISEIRENFELALNCEFDSLGKYEDYTFKDEKLSKLAKDYFEALNLQHKGLEHITYDNLFSENDTEDIFLDTWELGYAKRIVTISKINDMFPLTFNGKTNSIFRSMLKEYDYNYQFSQGREFMKKVNAKDIKLTEDTKKSDSWFTYLTCVVENITDNQFDEIEVAVDFYDKDGVIVSQKSDSVYDAKPGQKFRFNFSIDNDLEYSSYKTKLSIYYD